MHPGENSPHVNAIMERTARINRHASKYLAKVEVVEAKIPDSSFEEVVENGKVVLLIDWHNIICSNTIGTLIYIWWLFTGIQPE